MVDNKEQQGATEWLSLMSRCWHYPLLNEYSRRQSRVIRMQLAEIINKGSLCKVKAGKPLVPEREREVVLTGRELWAYSAHAWCRLQQEGFWDARHLRILSRSWLARSIWPLVYGGNLVRHWQWHREVYRLYLQNEDANGGPRSETTSSGRPCIRKT